MNNKQYEEHLLSVLTFCESLESPTDINYNEGNPFGMSSYDLNSMIRDLVQNNYIQAERYIGGAFIFSLTLEGRKKLEQLREEQQNQRFLVRIYRWFLNNWHYFLPFFKR